MRLILIAFLLCLAPIKAWSQSYGNEWINYNQKYLKFPVVSSGIYKITYEKLVNAGVPVNQISHQNFQIFAKQREEPIYVNLGTNNNFDAGDYLLFYGEKNNGWLDSSLYNNPNDIVQPNFSLFNDTLYYYFTWNNSVNNLRYEYFDESDFQNYTIQPYWFDKVDWNYYNNFVEMKDNYSDNISSQYKAGKGWGGTNLDGLSMNANVTFNFVNRYTGVGAPDARITLKIAGLSNSQYSGTGNHHVRFIVQSTGLELHNEIFIGYKAINIVKSFPSIQLNNGSTNFMLQGINDQGATTSTIRMQYAEVIFPKITTVTGLSKVNFSLRNDPTQNRTRLNITGANLYQQPIMLVKGSSPKFVKVYQNAVNTYECLIPNQNNDSVQRVFFENFASILNVDTLKNVSLSGYFTNFFANTSYDDKIIMIYHPILETATSNYQNYRTSIAGGNHAVVKINIEELYHQFGGGVNKHTLALKRFLDKVYTESVVKPKSLFLIGKGISEVVYRKTPAAYQSVLIPTYGYPGSDNLFTADFINDSWSPRIPTGRISVNTNSELQDYLDKIIEYEGEQNQSSIYNSADKEWQKQVLHFSGGVDAYQQNILQNYLNVMKGTIETQYFAGKVKSYAKSSSAPLDPNLLTDLNQRLKKGVSIMNFFGHASGSGFEINVDEPSNWDNKGKYPFIIGNACYTGDLFTNDISISEKFVRIANKGAIGFISSSKVGYISPLFQYSSELYRQISLSSYGQPIAKQIQSAISTLQVSTNIYTEAVCSQMILHGDPMLKINWHTKPEIEITQNSVSFKPEKINLDTDSLEINLVLKNLGISIMDTFNIEIIRKFPNSPIDSVYHISVPKLHYLDTIKYKVPLESNISIGLNTFEINVDIPSQIEEQYDEINNNRVVSTLFINLDGINPVYPYNYAVVPKDTITLKASTINPIAPLNTYRFEIDTTDLFNSPYHKYALKTENGGVKEVKYNEWRNVGSNALSQLILADSTVYFWRVSVDSTTYNWAEHSFQYIKNKSGWGQDHFFQFKNGSFNNILYDRTSRQRDFDTLIKRVKLVNYSNPNASSQYGNMAYFINDVQQEYQVCTATPSIHVAVIDPITYEPWKTKFVNSAGITFNTNYDFGNVNTLNGCRAREEAYFIFRQNTQAQLQNFVSMINSVPDGHILVIYSSVNAQFSNWTNLEPSVYTMFNNLGTNIFDTLQNSTYNRGFGMILKKGDPTSIVQQLGSLNTNGERLEMEYDMIGSDYMGVETSTVIGPSAKWETIYWKQNPKEAVLGDTTILTIKLFNSARILMHQIDTVMTTNDSIIQFNNLYNATQYPYMQLAANYTDSVSSTPAQVHRWHVLYQPLPEAAIDGTTAYTFLPGEQNISEGQKIKFAVDVKNISDYPMDSLLVNYWILDEMQNIHPITYPRQDSLRVNHILRDTIEFNSLGLAGKNYLWMEVNPYIDQTNTKTDQLEQYHFNNLLQVPFFVVPDTINPILDVTFDGRRIMNNDIINPFSELVITLKDENPLLIMNQDSDTTFFGIYLTNPAGVQTKIPFIAGNGQQIMQWIPAESNNKKFKIIYPAAFEMDGKYTLLVQGSDRSGNLSGNIEYKVTFEVIHESSITYLMNYPNPFTTNTRFVFTLTGSDIPEEMIIQIMTVTGKVVREITEDEIGPIHIGRNMSAYAWDGTDEFGDRLANGVYLYRVLSKIKGEDIKHRESGADNYFKKEFGKMYLMR